MNLQTQYEVKGATQKWVASFMQQHNVPASLMIDALNEALVDLKSKVIQEMFEEAYYAQAMAQQQAMQNREKEMSDGEFNEEFNISDSTDGRE